MIRKFLAVSLFALAIAIIAYGAFIEIDRQVVEGYIYDDGVLGLVALAISGTLALVGYVFWRWSN